MARKLQVFGNLGGQVDPSEVQRIVDAYLLEHPPLPGNDGISPIVIVEEIEGGHKITINDANGSQSFNIMNGVDGKDGANGVDGKDGQPGSDGKDGVDGKDGNGIASAVLNNDYTLTLTFDDGTTYITPSIRGATGEKGDKGDKGDPGEKGDKGDPGDPGVNGADGKDGVSPTVVITAIEGGHRVTINDAEGSKSFDVMNGIADTITEEELSKIAAEAAKLVTIDQVTPDQVVFPNGASTTYPLGKVALTNGMGTLVQPGGTLADFFKVFIDEKNPTTTQPSVSLTFGQAKAYEAGTNVTPSFSASLNPGSYTYGPATGIVAKSWEVTDTSGNKETSASGSFPQFQVVDGIDYKITAKATYDAGSVPVTNTGNEYSAGQIPEGSKSATSGAVTAYRNTFYGTLTAKSEITSDIVRGLASKSDKALANGSSFTIDIPVGALRVVFAYPATLRDVSSVKDVNGMNAVITSSFNKQTVDVEGANKYNAISYKVYTLDFANANDKANTFAVTI